MDTSGKAIADFGFPDLLLKRAGDDGGAITIAPGLREIKHPDLPDPRTGRRLFPLTVESSWSTLCGPSARRAGPESEH
jgi:hypothetical protein